MPSPSQPWHVLVDGVESVPAARRITGGIAVLAHGAGADFHPGLQRLDALIEIADYFGDIVPPPLREVASVSVFLIGIAVGEAPMDARGSVRYRNVRHPHRNVPRLHGRGSSGILWSEGVRD